MVICQRGKFSEVEQSWCGEHLDYKICDESSECYQVSTQLLEQQQHQSFYQVTVTLVKMHRLGLQSILRFDATHTCSPQRMMWRFL